MGPSSDRTGVPIRGRDNSQSPGATLILSLTLSRPEHKEERRAEDMERKQLSLSQEEGPQQKPTVIAAALTLDFQPPEL